MTYQLPTLATRCRQAVLWELDPTNINQCRSHCFSCGGNITDGSHVSGPYQGTEASLCPAKVSTPCEVCSDLVRLAEHKGMGTKYTRQVPLKHSAETCLVGRGFSKISLLASFNCIKQDLAPREGQVQEQWRQRKRGGSGRRQGHTSSEIGTSKRPPTPEMGSKGKGRASKGRGKGKSDNPDEYFLLNSTAPKRVSEGGHPGGAQRGVPRMRTEEADSGPDDRPPNLLAVPTQSGGPQTILPTYHSQQSDVPCNAGASSLSG